MRNPSPNADSGFTLIELAVVLVIIGFILGGIFFGRTLVRAALIRADISQMEKISTAINTFQSKYNALPGDITSTDANQFGFLGVGDGDTVLEDSAGFIQYPNDSLVGSNEPKYVFYQLAYTGLMWGSYDVTNNAITAWAPHLYTHKDFYYTVMSTNIDLGLWFFVAYPSTALSTNDIYTGTLNSSSVYMPAFTPAEAFAIDVKKDDGIPSTGNVLAVRMASPTSHLENVAASCVNTAAGLTYNVVNTKQACDLLIRVNQ